MVPDRAVISGPSETREATQAIAGGERALGARQRILEAIAVLWVQNPTPNRRETGPERIGHGLRHIYAQHLGLREVRRAGERQGAAPELAPVGGHEVDSRGAGIDRVGEELCLGDALALERRENALDHGVVPGGEQACDHDPAVDLDAIDVRRQRHVGARPGRDARAQVQGRLFGEVRNSERLGHATLIVAREHVLRCQRAAHEYKLRTDVVEPRLLQRGRPEPGADGGAQRDVRHNLIAPGDLAVDGVPEIAVRLVTPARIDQQPIGQLALEPRVDPETGAGAVDGVGRLEAGEALGARLFRASRRRGVVIDPPLCATVTELPRCRIPGLDAVILPPKLGPGHERHRLEPSGCERAHQVEIAGGLGEHQAAGVEGRGARRSQRRVDRIVDDELELVLPVCKAEVHVPAPARPAHPGAERPVGDARVDVGQHAVREDLRCDLCLLVR